MKIKSESLLSGSRKVEKKIQSFQNPALGSTTQANRPALSQADMWDTETTMTYLISYAFFMIHSESLLPFVTKL